MVRDTCIDYETDSENDAVNGAIKTRLDGSVVHVASNQDPRRDWNRSPFYSRIDVQFWKQRLYILEATVLDKNLKYCRRLLRIKLIWTAVCRGILLARRLNLRGYMYGPGFHSTLRPLRRS